MFPFAYVLVPLFLAGAGWVVGEFVQTKHNRKEVRSESDDEFVDPKELDPEEGDLIEYDRLVYQHWAVYIGNGDVIHIVDHSKGKAKVEKGNLINVAEGGKCRVNNLVKTAKSKGLKPRPKNEIVGFARKSLGTIKNYNITKQNCEHFATKCRYGKEFSLQGIATKGSPVLRATINQFARNSPNSGLKVSRIKLK